MPSIQLQKSELEKFLSLSSYTNLTSECIQLMPDTEYIKIELKRGFCTMSVSSVNSFVSYMFSTTNNEDLTILVSILHLREFLKGKRKDIITIDDSETTTLITDGSFKLSKVKKSDIKLEHFLILPVIKGIEYLRIERSTILKIIVSKKYIELKDKLRPILNGSSIKGKQLLSTDSTISCFYELDSEYSFSFFNQKDMELISEFDYIDYCKTENWNLIKYKTIVYGSRLTEGLQPGLMHEQINSFVKILDKSNTIRVNVEQFYDFCNSIKSSAKDMTVSTLLTIVENGIKLSYEDVKNNIEEASQIISAKVTGYEIGYSFKIYQFQIMKVMDSLNSEWINISECVEPNGNKGYIGFWLEEDKSFHSICSKAI